MDKNEKKGFLGVCVTAVKILLCVMFAFNAYIFIYYGMINRSEVPGPDPIRFVERWNVDEQDGKVVSLSVTLPTDIRDNEYFFFSTRKDVSVYVNGVLRADYMEKRDVNIPGGAIRRFYLMFPLNENDRGAELEMIRTLISEDEQIVPTAFISTRFGAFAYMMSRGGTAFVLASIVLIFSVVAFIVSVVLRFWYKQEIGMLYGSLTTITIAMWIISGSDMFPFVFGSYHVNTPLYYTFSLMIPFSLALYLNSVQHGRFKRFMPVLMTVACVGGITWPLLHFTGVLSFYSVRNIANVIFVLLAIGTTGILLVDAVKGNAREYFYVYIGFFGFLACCMVELMMLLMTSSGTSVPMVVGLGFLLVFIVIQQVDVLRKINAEKQHAIDISEAKTRFLASMSHEIRTPINSILGMNEMILRENNDGAIGEYSRSIKTSGKMLLMLVNDVLDFSKIEAGKLEINETGFYMSQMMNDVISLVKERADEKGLKLKTMISDKIPNEIISDEFRIRQILVNLINNAIKYTDKGIVTVKLSGKYTEEGFDLSFAVKDTGKGIKKEELPHLFEAFSRADKEQNANIEGTGLGLAIVKSIVDSMKGSVSVDSEYGVGSEFKVTLPVKYAGEELLNDDFMNATRREAPATGECDFSAPEARVLAVDDNQANLTVVKLFLKRTGIKLDLCSSGERAVELCRENEYDLLLLDHMMPKPDGIETLHLIRDDETSKNRETKAIVLTANAVAGSRKMYIDEGFADYLTKPLDAQVLEQTVKIMLPKEKVGKYVPEADTNSSVKTGEEKNTSDDDEILEFPATEESDTAERSELRQKLEEIEGFDYDVALRHCGGEEAFLEEIILDIVSECDERSERMRTSLRDKDLKAYAIDAHSLKSSMATIGFAAFSERAKKHEFAGKEGNAAFIEEDAEGLLKEYADICSKLKGYRQ
ncbi:MAG: response regulator [Lachnospiraceae bacterium]|nr:response regulator [Lachnospiraceae bacterium]